MRNTFLNVLLKGPSAPVYVDATNYEERFEKWIQAELRDAIRLRIDGTTVNRDGLYKGLVDYLSDRATVPVGFFDPNAADKLIGLNMGFLEAHEIGFVDNEPRVVVGLLLARYAHVLQDRMPSLRGRPLEDLLAVEPENIPGILQRELRPIVEEIEAAIREAQDRYPDKLDVERTLDMPMLTHVSQGRVTERMTRRGAVAANLRNSRSLVTRSRATRSVAPPAQRSVPETSGQRSRTRQWIVRPDVKLVCVGLENVTIVRGSNPKLISAKIGDGGHYFAQLQFKGDLKANEVTITDPRFPYGKPASTAVREDQVENQIVIEVPSGTRIKTVTCGRAEVVDVRGSVESELTGRNQLLVRRAVGAVLLRMFGDADAVIEDGLGRAVVDAHGRASALLKGVFRVVELKLRGNNTVETDGKIETAKGFALGESVVDFNGTVTNNEVVVGPNATVKENGIPVPVQTFVFRTDSAQLAR